MRIVRALFSIVATILVSIIFVMPYLGLVFLVVVSITVMWAFFGNLPTVLIVFGSVSLWAYPILVVMTFTFMTTWSYMTCCVGFDTFSGHLRHAETDHLENLAIAVFWPYAWFIVQRNFQDWGIIASIEVVCSPFELIIAKFEGVRREDVGIKVLDEGTVFVSTKTEYIK